MRIRVWDTRYCRHCQLRRVHYRTATGWHCVGTLPGATAVRGCGQEAA